MKDSCTLAHSCLARSQKLDAAWLKRLYRITRVKQYKTNRGAGFELEPLVEPGKKEPGLYRAQQLQRVLMQGNNGGWVGRRMTRFLKP